MPVDVGCDEPDRGGGRWHLADVLAATSGRLTQPGGSRRYCGVSTDTRKLRAGEIFVALQGPNHDGHRFIGEAIDRGAAAVVVQRGLPSLPPAQPSSGVPAAIVEVEDTLRALGDLASHDRRRLGLTVAAITGSNGKTTTKEMIAAILAPSIGADRLLCTVGTENNLIGLPLTLLRASGRERIAVLEMGMNAPGEIWRLAEIAAPDVGVVTTVAPAHIEGLGDIDGVARAKGELYRQMRPSATAIVNADDARVCEIAQCFPGRRLAFGAGAAVAAEAITSHGVEGVAFTLVIEGRTRSLRLPLPGRHNVTNALAAAAVCHALGTSLDDIATGLERLPRLSMRMEIERLPGAVTVINDAYNANPASVRSALALLGDTVAQGRIAVLGEMRELGSASAAAHRDVGRLAADHGVTLLVTMGPQAEEMRAGAIEAGMDAAAVVAVDTHAEAARHVRERVRPGDFVLLKGSRGARMEEVLAHLRTETT
jgi:UDP-N-acetylmuramoyl-tripeptide--D-alanyl-D-alanine ligase